MGAVELGYMSAVASYRALWLQIICAELGNGSGLQFFICRERRQPIPLIGPGTPLDTLPLSSRAGLCLSHQTGVSIRAGLCPPCLTRRFPEQSHVFAIRLRAPSLRVGAVCCLLSPRLSKTPLFFQPRSSCGPGGSALWFVSSKKQKATSFLLQVVGF